MNNGLAYYNESEPHAAEWLRNLIAGGELPAGDVDERPIQQVRPRDLEGYRHVHLFAGIGGWALAGTMAGWPSDLELWTGSPPCQPFSTMGRGVGFDDPRHLWPEFFRLVDARRPALVVGEQVAGQAGRTWFDGVHADMAGAGYACRAVDVPACAVDAPHRRARLFWTARRGMADAAAGRCATDLGHEGHAAQAQDRAERGGHPGRHDLGHCAASTWCSTWSDTAWLPDGEGKARRTKPGTGLLAHGLSKSLAGLCAVVPGGTLAAAGLHWLHARGAWRRFGNAVVPQLAAEVLGALLDD